MTEIDTEKKTLNSPIVSRRLKGLMAENDMTVSDLSNKMDLPHSVLAMKISGQIEWLFLEAICVVKHLGFSEFKEVFPEIYDYILKT